MANKLLKDGDEIEVFRAGTHTDSQGRTRTYSVQDVDNIVAAYNAQPEGERHEAPIVIGHPRDNHPAWGWVKQLVRKGTSLYAQVHKLVPQFQEWVNNHMYEKRSISLYPDMRLRHIGFLGGVPPAVKGLQVLGFSEDAEVIEMEFGEDSPRAARAQKFGVTILEGKGQDTVPTGLNEESFADPVNLRFPLTSNHVQSTLASWSRAEVQKDYSEKDRQIIAARIIKAASSQGIDLTPYRWRYSDSAVADIVDRLVEKPALLAAVKKQVGVNDFFETKVEKLLESKLVQVVTGKSKKNSDSSKNFEGTEMSEEQVAQLLSEILSFASERFGEEIASELSTKTTELQQKFTKKPAGPALSDSPEIIALNERYEASQREIQLLRAKDQLNEDNSYFTEQLRQGQVKPAQRELVMSSLQLARKAMVVDFNDGGTIVQKPSTDVIKGLISSFEKQVHYGEQGDDSRTGGSGTREHEEFPNASEDSVRIDGAVRKYIEEQQKMGKVVSYRDALDHVIEIETK